MTLFFADSVAARREGVFESLKRAGRDESGYWEESLTFDVSGGQRV